MIKKWIFYTSIAVIVGFISSGFQTLENQKTEWFFATKNQLEFVTFPTQDETNYQNYNTPFSGNSFTGYKEALAFKESQGQWKRINKLGYMGKYQFGKAALQTIGIENSTKFLNNPELQEKAFVLLLSINKAELQSEISMFHGKMWNGIFVTESGILAAAHLGGAASVKKFFRSNGKISNKDAFGTTIKSYLEKFSGYDTSIIVADKDAKI